MQSRPTTQKIQTELTYTVGTLQRERDKLTRHLARRIELDKQWCHSSSQPLEQSKNILADLPELQAKINALLQQLTTLRRAEFAEQILPILGDR